jgi:hypothetical protein
VSRRRGRNLVQKLELDGHEISIYLDFSAGGVFKVELPSGDVITDDVYSSAIIKAEEWINGHRKLKFEPIIIAEYSNHAYDEDDEKSTNEGQLSLRYRRFFRAPAPGSTKERRQFLWKIWVEIGKTEGMTWDQVNDLTEGKPGSETRSPFYFGRDRVGDEPDKDEVIIPYTAARWTTLRAISKAMRGINERIRTIFREEHAWGFEKFLDRVEVGGAGRLFLGDWRQS